MSGQFVAVSGNLAGVVLLVNQMTPENFGTFSLAIAYAFLMHMYFSSAMNAVMRNYAATVEAGTVREYIASFEQLALNGTWTIVGSTTVIVFAFLGCGRQELAYTSLLVAIYALLSGYSVLLIGFHVAARKVVHNALIKSATPWFRVLSALVGIHFFGAGFRVSLYGYIAGTALLVACQTHHYLRLKSNLVSQNSGEFKSEVFQHLCTSNNSYTNSYIVFVCLICLYNNCDRWILSFLCTPHDVGIFSMMYQLGYVPFMILGGLLSHILAPPIFSKAGDGNDPVRLQNAQHFIHQMVLLMSGVSLIMTVVAYVCGQFLIETLTNAQYWGHAGYFSAMVMAGCCQTIGQIASYSSMINHKLDRLIKMKFVHLITATVVSLFMVYQWGLSGALLGVLVHSLLGLVMSIYVMNLKLCGVSANQSQEPDSRDELETRMVA
jgi:O-antigen/teichoic acid export membrane protein